jgi:hypothetical protein
MAILLQQQQPALDLLFFSCVFGYTTSLTHSEYSQFLACISFSKVVSCLWGCIDAA